jgi:hypothetical protein
MRSLIRALRSLTASALVVAAGACLSPTLPLPPPEEPSLIGESADGIWQVAGSCLEGAQVLVLNETTGRGAVYVDRAAAGHYTVEIEGTACDVVVVSQTLGDESSGGTRIVLQATQDGLPVDPTACTP